MRLVKSKPLYCTECDGDTETVRVRFQNPLLAQNASIALCETHAGQLGDLLTNHVRRLRFKRLSSSPPLPSEAPK